LNVDFLAPGIENVSAMQTLIHRDGIDLNLDVLPTVARLLHPRNAPGAPELKSWSAPSLIDAIRAAHDARVGKPQSAARPSGAATTKTGAGGGPGARPAPDEGPGRKTHGRPARSTQ
jgi:hypothetical protein